MYKRLARVLQYTKRQVNCQIIMNIFRYKKLAWNLLHYIYKKDTFAQRYFFLYIFVENACNYIYSLVLYTWQLNIAHLGHVWCRALWQLNIVTSPQEALSDWLVFTFNDIRRLSIVWCMVVCTLKTYYASTCAI